VDSRIEFIRDDLVIAIGVRLSLHSSWGSKRNRGVQVEQEARND